MEKMNPQHAQRGPQFGMPMIELILADGEPLDIPVIAITHFEGMHKGKNPNFPDARCYARYTLGKDSEQVLLLDTFEDLLRKLNINAMPGNWILLTRQDGDRLAVLKGNILIRQGIKEEDANCKLTVTMEVDGSVGVFKVQETRDQVKEKMDSPLPTTPASEAIVDQST